MSAAAPLALRPLFSFTYHATDRFMTRVWPTICPTRPCADAREALTTLVDAATRAELSPRRTDRGHAVWTIADPAMRWITKPGEHRGRRVAVVVTVLDGLEDIAAEEEAEREVLEAAQRMASVPALGTQEPTLPPPAAELGSKAYRAWVALEVQRIAVEKDRLATLRKVAEERNPALAYSRIQHQRIAAEQQEAARRAKTERHAMSVARDQKLADARELLGATMARLAEVDPVRSAGLLERARAALENYK